MRPAADAHILGRFEGFGRGDGGRRRDQRRCEQQRVTGLARQASDIQAHELLRACRYRQLARGVFPAANELSRDLERVEGVAFRAFDDPHDRRTR
jgi:hypothetical protein